MKKTTIKSYLSNYEDSRELSEALNYISTTDEVSVTSKYYIRECAIHIRCLYKEAKRLEECLRKNKLLEK